MARRNTTTKKNITTPGQTKLTEALVPTSEEIVEEAVDTAIKTMEEPAQVVETPTAAPVVTEEKEVEETMQQPETTACCDENKQFTSSVTIQFNGKSFVSCELKAKATEDWATKGNSIDDINELEVYVNVDESTVYYVVNGIEAGSFEI